MKKSNTNVIKADKLIQIKHGLTAHEKKFVEYVISLIKEDDKPTKRYAIGFNLFVELFSPESIGEDTEEELKKLIRKFQQKVLVIDQNKPMEWWGLGWIADVCIHMKEQLVSFRLNYDLHPFLLNKKERYYLNNLVRLENQFATKIYALLKKFEKVGNIEIEITEFRQLLDIEGKYYEFYDIKRMILKIVQKELKEKTDISFDFEVIKIGRTVKGIKFIIFSNLQKEKEVVKVY